MLGDFQSARTSCEVKPGYSPNQVCLALTYEKLGRHAEAEAMRRKLNGTFSAYWGAEIYAQRGDTAKALEWLETALRVRDSSLINLKTDRPSP
jgi:tetratricopeptide (TPR) repeat protein